MKLWQCIHSYVGVHPEENKDDDDGVDVAGCYYDYDYYNGLNTLASCSRQLSGICFIILLPTPASHPQALHFHEFRFTV